MDNYFQLKLLWIASKFLDERIRFDKRSHAVAHILKLTRKNSSHHSWLNVFLETLDWPRSLCFCVQIFRLKSFQIKSIFNRKNQKLFSTRVTFDVACESNDIILNLVWDIFILSINCMDYVVKSGAVIMVIPHTFYWKFLRISFEIARNFPNNSMCLWISIKWELSAWICFIEFSSVSSMENGSFLNYIVDLHNSGRHGFNENSFYHKVFITSVSSN